MTLACAYRHELEVAETNSECRVQTTVNADKAKTVFSLSATPGTTLRLTKFVSYHSSKGVPAAELVDRCHRTLSRAADMGVEALYADQKTWLDAFWQRSDIEVVGDDAAQQAIRWNLFQLAQASAQTQEQGIAAKGITAAATTATTSGTPRYTCCRSSPTPTRWRPASCSGSGGRCCQRPELALRS